MNITKKRKYKNNKHGFTLVEVIVVLVIIGILAGVAVPSLTGYITRMHANEVMRQARSMERAMYELVGQQYAATESGKTPIVKTFTGGGQLQLVSEGNFIYIDSGSTLGSSSAFVGHNYLGTGTKYLPVYVANTQLNEQASRKSKGISDFYKLTNLNLANASPLPGTDNPTYNSKERRRYAVLYYDFTSLGFDSSNPSYPENAEGKEYAYTPGYLNATDAKFSLYFVEYEGAYYMVMHNWKLKDGEIWIGSGSSTESAENKWYIYKNTNSDSFAYDPDPWAVRED